MPYEGVGARHTATATKVCHHGQIVEEEGFVGTAFKATQVDRFTRPADAATIAIGEDFEIQLGGVHEAPLAAGINAVDVSDKVFINPADNALLATFSAGGTDEVQTVTPPGSGTFTLTLDGETTAAIAFNAAASAVRAALEGLSNIAPGDVVVTGTGPYVITFHGEWAGEDVPTLVASAGSVATGTPGVAGADSLPVGIVTEIDTVRDICRINSNAWQAFLPGA